MNHRWQRIIIPIQALLLLSQPVTGFLFEQSDNETLSKVHLITGILLIVLVVIHIGLNRDWLARQYRRRTPPKAE